MSKPSLIAAVAIVAVSIAGCPQGTDESGRPLPLLVQSYELNVSISGEGSVEPDGGIFDAGSTVTVTATPASGWRFDQWEGDISSTDQSIEVTLDSDLSVQVVFIEVFELTVSIQGEGSVEPDGGTFDAGSTVTLTATPVDGWLFGSWGGDASGTDSEVDLLIDADKSVRAELIALAGYRAVSVDNLSGRMTLAVRGTKLRGIRRNAGGYGYEMRGTISGRQVTLTSTSEGFQPATIGATVQLSGAWIGTIGGSGYNNDPFVADEVSLTGFDHPAAGYRTITVKGHQGTMILAINGDLVRGNAILGTNIGVDIQGTVSGNQLTLTLSSPGTEPSIVFATFEDNGALMGTITGSGFNNDQFIGDPVTFP